MRGEKQMVDIQGITKRALARALGISEPTLYRWIEKGTLEKNIERLQKEVVIRKEFEPIRELKVLKQKKALK